MDYFGLGDVLSYGDLNALVYLLRKFKRLTSDLELGETDVSSDYGVYHFGTGLTSVGGNYIIESPVTITSSDVLRNCLYSFIFTVVDVNLSGTVNKRTVSVTGDTGNYGQLSITLPMDLIGSDEQILPDFSVDIVFDPHEYYTSVSDLNVSLDCEEDYIIKDETNLINAYITDSGGSPVIGITVAFNVNGTVYTATTDSDGVAELEYTGLGSVGKVTVNALGEELVFFDGGVLAEYTGNTITLHNTDGTANWLGSNGTVFIDWGDGEMDEVNNPTSSLSHGYTDNQSSHIITFTGDITSLGIQCFYGCTGLTSVSIPESVTSLGIQCFSGCTSLVDYQLYWTNTAIIPYENTRMPNNTNTIFTIPRGQTNNYGKKGYPVSKLQERGDLINTTLALSSSASEITIGESITLTSTLKDINNTPINNAPINIFERGVNVGFGYTDSNGVFSVTLTGLSDGIHTFYALYEGDSFYAESQSSDVVTVNKYPTSISLSAISSAITIGDTPQVTGRLTSNGVGVSGATIHLSIPNDLVELTTGNDGSFSYTGSATTGEGNLRFKAVFLGDSTHNNSSSKAVFITVNKISTTTSLSASSTSILTTDSLTLSGSVTGASTGSVKIYNGSTLVDTVTLSSGAYSTTLTGLTAGTYNYKAEYQSDSTHSSSESSVVQVTVSEPTPTHNYALALSGTAIIESGDSDTITATVTDNGTAVSGVVLDYEVKHGSTTISTGTTSATDSNGQATITYTGTGVGDVDVIVSYGSLLQETYIVEDCLYYGNWNKITTDFLSTNFVSGRTIWYLNTNYQTDVELSFKFKNNVPTQFLAGFGDTNGTSTAWAKLMFYRIGTTSWALFKDNSSVSLSGVSATTDTIFKLQTQNLHTIKAYIDDTLKSTQSTNSSYGLNIRFDDYTSYPMELEYLKVKAL